LPDAREAPQQLVRSGISFTKCRYCNYHIPTERFQAHTENCVRLWKKKNARKRSGVPLKPAPVSPSPPGAFVGTAVQPRGMTTCTICKCRLYAKNLARHLKRTHSTEPVRNELPRTVHSDPVTIPPESALPELVRQGPQDASKYIGHFARDRGQFGSMPSYDDFSDEGGPD
jgi:hypothetical protein